MLQHLSYRAKQETVLDFNVFLFNDYASLDVFGPVDICARIPDWNIRFVSKDGGPVISGVKSAIDTIPASEADKHGIFFIPGGFGTRPLSKDAEFLKTVKEFADQSPWCLSVCTGSVLLAAAGVLDGRKATSNKFAFKWAQSFAGPVWQKSARWTSDGKFYTSSGVAAGMDMALGFVADRYSAETSEDIAARIEYVWSQDPENDPFQYLEN